MNCLKILETYKHQPMKLLLGAILLVPYLLNSQVTDGEFISVYKSIQNKSRNAFILKAEDSTSNKNFELLKETNQLLDFLYEYIDSEHRLNGKGGFNFAGNQTSKNNLFKVGAGVSIDQGVYPYELDFSANVQSLLKDGDFQENFSDLDISFDFHPYTPSAFSKQKKYEAKINELEHEKTTNSTEEENKQYLLNKYMSKIEKVKDINGLWLENYVILKRSSDSYLGLDQAYNLGAGFIFSFYSKAMTKKGRANQEEMNRKPTYEMHGNDLIRCLTNCAPINNVLQLSASEIETLMSGRYRFLISNRKQYSQLRLSLLVGAYYELEKSTISNTINFNGKDTTMSFPFKPTNRPYGEIRPGIVWKPKDKYKLKIYPFLKIPLDRIKDKVSEGALSDIRTDYFIDFQSSFTIAIEDNFEIGIYYNMLYDNTPYRLYLKQSDNSFILFSGENKRSSFGINLSFGF